MTERKVMPLAANAAWKRRGGYALLAGGVLLPLAAFGQDAVLDQLRTGAIVGPLRGSGDLATSDLRISDAAPARADQALAQPLPPAATSQYGATDAGSRAFGSGDAASGAPGDAASDLDANPLDPVAAPASDDASDDSTGTTSLSDDGAASRPSSSDGLSDDADDAQPKPFDLLDDGRSSRSPSQTFPTSVDRRAARTATPTDRPADDAKKADAADPAARRRGSDAALAGLPNLAGDADTVEDARLRQSRNLAEEPERRAGFDRSLSRQNLPVTGLRPMVPTTAEDPFAPVGLRLGSFVLTSALEQSAGYSTNVSLSPGGASGLFTDTAVSARLRSDWSLHEAEINAMAAYRRNFAGDIEEDPHLVFDGRLRLDIERDLVATINGGFEYRREAAADADSPAELATRPQIYTTSLGGDVQKTFGRFSADLGADLRRDGYAEETAGTPGQSYTTLTGRLRGGYEISPALQPFLEASLARRLFDDEKDDTGRSRNSLIEAMRAGISLDFGDKLNGELALGYAVNVPDADELDTVGSPTIDAKLAWSPWRGTDVIFTGTTRFDPDTQNIAPATVYEASLGLRHRATERLDLNAAVTAGYRDSDVESDRERTLSAEGGATYWVNRSLALTGLLRHETVDSEAPGSDYSAESARIGLKLQR